MSVDDVVAVPVLGVERLLAGDGVAAPPVPGQQVRPAADRGQGGGGAESLQLVQDPATHPQTLHTHICTGTFSKDVFSQGAVE